MVWACHETQRHTSIAHNVMHGRTPRNRRKDRPRTTWLQNIQDWTNPKVTQAVQEANNRTAWNKRVATTSALLRPE